jgi:hypothetical protein
MLVALAAAACVAQYEYTREVTPWEAACTDVSERFEVEACDYDPPAIVRNSLLVMELTGAFGISVYDEWRLYLAPVWYIVQGGYTEEQVEYHELIHLILHKDNPVDRCESEHIAREMTDERYGSDSLNAGWEIVYQCTSPSNLL